MKISIDRLKEIIKEEIAGTNPKNVQQDPPTAGSNFDDQVNSVVTTILNRQQIKDGLDDLATQLQKYDKNMQMKGSIIGLILQTLGVDTSDQKFMSLMGNVKSRTTGQKNNEF